MNEYRKRILLLFPGVLMLLLSCSPSHYRRQADSEVHGIIAGKSRDVPGMHEEFSAEYRAIDPLEELPLAPMEAALPGSGDEEGEPRLLVLKDAMHIAAANSREYQNRRESLFLAALSLTGERNRFIPRFFWKLRGSTTYDSEDRWSAGAESGPGAEWLLATGARLSAGLSTTATRFLSGDTTTAARSVFDLTLTQPLLAGSRIAVREPLTQAERDMMYELREFVRYQRRFSVDVVNSYYRVLEQRQRVENQQINFENLVRIRRRAEALGEAGRLPELQVDRARQNELSAREGLDAAHQNYRQALDGFKFRLGIGPETALLLDPAELERLHELDMTPPPSGERESIGVALDNRLDLVTRRERVEDAERKIRVAQNALKPGLNLVLGTSARTQDNRPVDFAGGTQSSFARLEADLPLDRTSERNTYRRRLIEYDRALRDFEEARDGVVLDVLNRRRDLDRAVSSYAIQHRSVELAQARVDSTEMLFDAGRASTTDLLDAHEDLLRVQNALTGTLVDFRVATLELQRDMDILVIDEQGQILERAGDHDDTGSDD